MRKLKASSNSCSFQTSTHNCKIYVPLSTSSSKDFKFYFKAKHKSIVLFLKPQVFTFKQNVKVFVEIQEKLKVKL